jgi:hypothetical protein
MYVGLAGDVGSRFKKHLQASPWAAAIGSISVEQYATRKEAANAEKIAIDKESPPFNRKNVKFKRTVIEVLVEKEVHEPESEKVDDVEQVDDIPMRNELQLRQAMQHQTNVTQFCQRHRLPERTIWRFLAGGRIRRGTAKLLDDALDVERGVKA